MNPQKLASFSCFVASVPGSGGRRTVRVSAVTESGTVYYNRTLTDKPMNHKTASRVCRFFDKMPPAWVGDVPGNADAILLWEDGPIKLANMTGKNSLNTFIESVI